MAKLRHVAVNTPNVEDDARFFREAFGMQEVGRLGQSPNLAIYLSDGVMNLAVINITDPDFPNYQPKGLNHIGFVVDDLDETIARAEKAGAVATVERKHDLAGPTWEMKMRSPSGVDLDISDHGWPGVSALN